MSRGDNRFSSLTRRGKLAIPDGSYKIAEIASTYGRTFGPGDSFAPIGPRNRPVGVLLESSHRDQTLSRLGLSTSRWYEAVDALVNIAMAHRCRRGTVAMFLEPQTGASAACTFCHAALGSGETGTAFPVGAELSSGGAGTSPAPIAASTSDNAVSPGGSYGVEGGVSQDAEPLTPEVIAALRHERVRAQEIAALDLVKRQLGATEASA